MKRNMQEYGRMHNPAVNDKDKRLTKTWESYPAGRQLRGQVLGQASKVSIHCFEWQGLSNCSGEDTSAGANTEACYACMYNA